MENKRILYSDNRYMLFEKDKNLYLKTESGIFSLTSTPYEPCLYITDETGKTSIVHNAFTADEIIYFALNNLNFKSITGFEYDIKDFCKMAEYASKEGDISIDTAEKVFADRDKNKTAAAIEKQDGETGASDSIFICPDGVSLIENDSFYELANEYPDSAVDFCLVKNEGEYSGINSHWNALIAGALHIITDDWELSFEAGKITAKQVSTEELFAKNRKSGKLSFYNAFLNPPYANDYNENDFISLISALFPEGTDNLEAFSWSTDWSDYFDDGKEWWGTLCLTVYDKSKKRFAVIMASATD